MMDKKEHDSQLRFEKNGWIVKKKNLAFVAVFCLCLAIVSTVILGLLSNYELFQGNLKIIYFFLWFMFVVLPMIFSAFFGIYLLVLWQAEQVRSFDIMKQPIFCEKCKNELMEFIDCNSKIINNKNNYFANYKCLKCDNYISKKISETDYNSWQKENNKNNSK